MKESAILTLGSLLLNKLKKLDDKQLLVKVQLSESNIQKVRFVLI
jgi:hypothetical protein